MQNRPNAFTQRGGDTVLMEKLSAEMQRLGIEVTIDVECTRNPAEFDVVHLFNFTTVDLTKELAQRAWNAGTPYVVTALYEDVPAFHNQSIEVANALVEYTRGGQDRNWWAANAVEPGKVPAAPGFANHWTAEHAAAIISSGSEETRALKRDYPAAHVVETSFGHEVGGPASADMFVQQYGMSDFVLCVGRIESRKNQLMLLKALEDSEIPVVIAGGGFTYQPGYDQAVRNFRRRGKTLVLGRISPEMLASAYRAARVHCLPSWYELPGLVTLEAASYGCNVVASASGTIHDYLGEKVFYCDAWNEHSIRNAVLAAYYSPLAAGLKESAMRFTWAETARRTHEVYVQAAARKSKAADAYQPSSRSVSKTMANWAQPADVTSSSAREAEVEPSFLVQGEEAARNREFQKAHELLTRAWSMNPRSARTCKALGAVFLAESNHKQAWQWFERGHELDPDDPRILSGMGMCLMMENNPQEAYHYFVRSLEIAPDHLVTLMQLVDASYRVCRFDHLEKFLRAYVMANPSDMEMLFCHAGCLFKLGRNGEALQLAQRVLAANSQHLGARQLLEILQNAQTSSSPSPALQPEGRNGNGAKPVSTFAFDNVDSALLELEEKKRRLELDTVIQGTTAVLGRDNLQPEQREKAQILRAEAAVLSADTERASRIYGEVLSANPRSARAICGQGALAASQGDWQKAQRLFETALACQPEYDVGLAGLGLCRYNAGDNQGAWDCYCRANKANPENHRALLGIIELGYAMNRLEEVEQAIEGYLEMHPGDLDFLYSLAGCCFARGKTDQALSELGKVLLLNPEHEKARELKEVIESRQSELQAY